MMESVTAVMELMNSSWELAPIHAGTWGLLLVRKGPNGKLKLF